MLAPNRLDFTRLAIAILFACTAGAAGAATYTLVDLGQNKYPSQINGRGDVAGSTRHGHAILRHDGHWDGLYRGQSEGNAINAYGDVAGDVRSIPVLWQRGLPTQKVRLPGGSTFGLGLGINAQREMVGLFEGSGRIRCFSWTPAGGSVDLGFMGDGDYCEALDVNALGQITGLATTATSQGKTHAFRYQDGMFEDLGILAGGDQSQGLSINRHGDVAGRASVPPLDDMHFHAVVWTHGNLIDLDPNSTTNDSIAVSINNRGEVVGNVTLGSVLDKRAVRFTPQGVVRLQDEVRNLDGWTLSQAAGVNDDGVIVGDGFSPDGNEHGFMLIPDRDD